MSVVITPAHTELLLRHEYNKYMIFKYCLAGLEEAFIDKCICICMCLGHYSTLIEFLTSFFKLCTLRMVEYFDGFNVIVDNCASCVQARIRNTER